jgi:hypothetical protein
MNVETPILAFQLNSFSKEHIKRTINEYPEGMFNLNTKIGTKLRNAIFGYINETYKNYNFKLEKDLERYNLIFKTKNTGESNAQN